MTIMPLPILFCDILTSPNLNRISHAGLALQSFVKGAVVVMFFRAGRAVSRRTLSADFRCALAVSLLLALCHATAQAQIGSDTTGNGGRHVIQGRLVNPSGRRVDARLRVKLESNSNLSGDLSVLADANGAFSFHGLNAGTYTVIIEGDGFETVRETVRIESNASNPRRGIIMPTAPRPYTLQIYLKPKSGAGFEVRPGVVNAALASVPKPAIEQFNKAMESARKGETAKAVEQLQAALTIHPDFALALSELGVQHLKLRQPDKAAEALRAALKLAPDDYITLVTYGVALIDKREFGQAEEPLRAALKKNATLPFAPYYLGVALLRQKKLGEAEKSLRQAVGSGIGGEHLGLAHYYLGGVYWANQDYKRAVGELETYLRLSPDLPAAARDRVRATIKDLRAKM